MLNKILIVLYLLFILISCDMSAKEYSKEEIKSKNKMYKNITEKFNSDDVIISAVLLRDFLYSL